MTSIPTSGFFLSGSAPAGLRTRSTGSLAGRILDFSLLPLSFEEFLLRNGKNTVMIKKDPELWKQKIISRIYR